MTDISTSKRMNNNISHDERNEENDDDGRKNSRSKSNRKLVCNMSSQECQNYLQQVLENEKLNETVELTNEEAAQLTNDTLRQRLLERVANNSNTLTNAANHSNMTQPEFFDYPKDDDSSSSHESSSSSEDDDEEDDREEQQEEQQQEEEEEEVDDDHDASNLNTIPEEKVKIAKGSKPKRTKQKKYVKKSKADKKLDEMMKSLGTPPFRVYDITTTPDENSSTDGFVKNELHVPAVWNGDFPFSNVSSNKMSGSAKVGVLLCRSGKFALSIFDLNNHHHTKSNTQSRGKGHIVENCLDHRTASRYTVRKGQGKSQSAADSGKKIKSMGSQLRRAGEVALQKDITTILQDLQHHLQDTHTLFLHCPNANLYHQTILPNLPSSLLTNNNRKLKRIPLSIKRPTYLATRAVYQILTNCHLITKPIENSNISTTTTNAEEEKKEDAVCRDNNESRLGESKVKADVKKIDKKEEVTDIPLTLMHEAARDGNLEVLSSLLESHKEEINFKAGPDLWTPLHYASAGNHSSCISKLLIHGLADPSMVDIRSRPPVFLCATETSRNAYRIARFELSSEEHSNIVWTGVGPPISMEQLEGAKLKKKQKQKAKKQKQKAAKKKKDQEVAAAAQKQKQEEEAAAAAAATARATTLLQRLCDFCKLPYKKKNEFTKLEYKYCSIECVKKHQRQLMADAALARYGK